MRIVPPAAVLSGTLLLGTPSVQPCSNTSVGSDAALSGLVMSVLAISAFPQTSPYPPHTLGAAYFSTGPDKASTGWGSEEDVGSPI